jgi:hypothetical protein
VCFSLQFLCSNDKIFLNDLIISHMIKVYVEDYLNDHVICLRFFQINRRKTIILKMGAISPVSFSFFLMKIPSLSCFNREKCIKIFLKFYVIKVRIL